MKIISRLSIIIVILGTISLVLFFSWYRGGQPPLSAEEQHFYLEKIESQTGTTGEFINTDENKEFLRTDDGKGFYVVNLFRFNDKANYQGSRSEDISGKEAFNLFTQTMIPLWISKGSHPVFSSAIDGKKLGEWDFVSVVRYRSRRDFFAIQTGDEFIAILSHRIAAAETNARIKIAGNQIPLVAGFFLLIWILVLLLLSAGVWVISRRFKSGDTDALSRHSI